MSHSTSARDANVAPKGAPSRRGFLGLAAAAMLGLPACATRPLAQPGQVPPFSRAPTVGVIPPGWNPYVLRRDLRADFRAAFGEEAGRLLNVGVLTDSDDLNVDVQAWYGDITLSSL
jgi:hypothetical protein